MKLKPRAARRLLLLGVLALVFIVGAVGLIGVRSWQKERRSQKLRAEGMAALDRKDDYGTVDSLGQFLRRKPDDREAWLAFAQARERIEEPSGRHLHQTLLAYSRAWALDESDKSVARKLLKLYNMLGQHPEARDLAMRLRPKDPAGAGPELADVLREEAAARVALKAFDPTLDAITQRLVSLEPEAYQSAFLRSRFLLGAGRTADVLAFTEGAVAARPQDPRAIFLREMVRINTGDKTPDKQFTEMLAAAAGLEPVRPLRVSQPAYSEPEFAAQLLTTFDSLGMYRHSLLVLQDAVERLKDPDSARLLARRTWQAGLAPEIISRYAGPGSDPAALHPEILGFLALARIDLGEKPAAVEILTHLRSRERNAIAQPWAKLLSALLEQTEAREALSLIDAAVKIDPGEPVFGFFRAETLARLGRIDEAREAWASLYKSPASDGWAAPAVRIAESFLDEGRLDDGLNAATDSLRRFPASASANLTLLRAQTSLIEAGRTPPDAAAVLARLDDISRRLAGAPESGAAAAAVEKLSLPSRVALLCSLGRKPEALAILESAVAKPQSLTPELARRFAAVSARAGLGMEDRLLAAAQGATGNDAGSLLTRALLLDSVGKRDDALKLVNDALTQCLPAEKPTLEIVRAQLLDSFRHPDALASWKKLVADHPNSLPAHFAALRSSSCSADLAFIDQLAARLTELGGSDADRPSAEVRLARSRALLHGTPTAKSRDEALSILRAMMVGSPSLAARDLFIDAMLLDDPARGIKPDYPAAIEQLTAAAAIANNRAPYAFRLASVLQRQGRSREAAAELSKLAIDSAADRRDRLEAIDRLSTLREVDSALRAVDAMLGSTQGSPPDLLTRRAALLAALRRDREAIETYRRVLDHPIDDPESIVTVAAGLEALGDSTLAQRAIDKLDQPGVSPATKAVALGRLAANRGDYEAAHAQFTHATELAPDDARGWSALARLSLQRGEFSQAEASAQSGLQHIPQSAELAVLLQQARLASRPGDKTDLSGLADALDKLPGMQRRAAAIRAVEKAKANAQIDEPATLLRLSDEFSDDATTQLFVSRRLSSLNPPRLTEAAALLRLAANRFPADPSVQEQATRTLAAIGDWDSALSAATAWRALTRSPQADLAVGEAQLSLAHPRPALDAVTAIRLPTPPSIAPDDTLSLGALNVRVHALAALDDSKAAFQTLRPYLSSGVARVNIGLPVAAEVVTPLEEARHWIDQIAAAATPDDPDELLAIASAWGRLAERFPASKADLLKQALAATDALASGKAAADARVLQTRARLLAASGDASGAIAAGRAALAVDPKNPASLLGLAKLLLDTNADPAEAASLARRAAEINPESPSPLVVLAAAQLQQAETRAAAGDQQGRETARHEAAQTLKQFNTLSTTEFAPLNDMAVAAERLEDLPAAIGLYERAIASPQAPTGRSLAIVKNNLAFAIYLSAGVPPSSQPLNRAKSLAEEAIEIAPLAPFLDTLGAINTAMNDSAAAIAAYRRALALDPNALTSSIGLAALLADGTPDERSEAVALVKRVDAAPAAAKTLSPERQRQLQEVRSKLAAH